MHQPRTDTDLVSPDTCNHVSAANDRLNGCELTHHGRCVPETLRRMAEASQPGKDHDLLPDVDGDPPGPEDLEAGLALIGGEQWRLRQIERDLIEARMDAGGTWADIARARQLPSADAARMRYRDQLGGQRTWTRRKTPPASLAENSHDSHERWMRNAEQLRDESAATTAELGAHIDRLHHEET